MKKSEQVVNLPPRSSNRPTDLQPNKLSTTKPRRRASQVVPPMRVVIDSNPKVRKAQFAFNLDRLLKLLGLSRKEAAEELNLSYQLVRRLVTRGVSRLDERNEETLTTIVNFFALSDIEDLWIGNLVDWLLTAKGGEKFVKKFRKQLAEYRQRQLQTTTQVSPNELGLLGQALGVEKQDDAKKMADYLKKTEMILSSGKSESFCQIIDDYHEFITKKRKAV